MPLALTRAHTHTPFLLFSFSQRELVTIEQVEAQIALRNYLGKSICSYTKVYNKASSEAESAFPFPGEAGCAEATLLCLGDGQDWMRFHLCLCL